MTIYLVLKCACFEFDGAMCTPIQILCTQFLKVFIMINDAAGVTGHYPITWATQNYNIGTRAFKMLSELTAIIIRIIWTFPFKKIIIIIYVHITFVQLGTRLPST